MSVKERIHRLAELLTDIGAAECRDLSRLSAAELKVVRDAAEDVKREDPLPHHRFAGALLEAAAQSALAQRGGGA